MPKAVATGTDSNPESRQQSRDAVPILLLDASIYIFRYYFSLPPSWFSQPIATGRGHKSVNERYSTEAVYGYSRFLLQCLNELRPQFIAACFDASLGSCFRNEIYPGYKTSRALPDAALAFQLNACREITELLGIPSFASKTYEADDLLGSLMCRAQEDTELSQYPVAILTRDKDLGQLLQRQQDYLWDFSPGKSGLVDHSSETNKYRERLGCDEIFDKFGVWPEQLADYLALVGDSIDDIPGVAGVGAKTAARLLQYFGSIDEIYRNLEQVPTLGIRGAASLSIRLTAHREQVVMSRSLAQIATDAPLPETDQLLRRRAVDMAAVNDFFERMGLATELRSLLQETNEIQQRVSA